MQSTGHSSMHALSLMSTQGSAIVYVTDISSMYCVWAAVRLAAALRRLQRKLSVTDTRRFTYTSTTGHARRIADAGSAGGGRAPVRVRGAPSNGAPSRRSGPDWHFTEREQQRTTP